MSKPHTIDCAMRVMHDRSQGADTWAVAVAAMVGCHQAKMSISASTYRKAVAILKDPRASPDARVCAGSVVQATRPHEAQKIYQMVDKFYQDLDNEDEDGSGRL